MTRMINEQELIKKKLEALTKEEKPIVSFPLALLLEIAITGSLLLTALVAPNALMIFKNLLGKKRNPFPSEIKRQLKRVQKEGLVAIGKKGGKTIITITKAGKRKVLKYSVDQMKIKKPGEWDRIWRIIAFDIPEKKKVARNIFRQKLKDLGFKQLQKSVWAYKYPCLDEITFLIHLYEIGPYVTYFEGVIRF